MGNSITNTLHVSPLQATAWYTPIAVGGLVLSLGSSLILHIVSSYLLLLAAGLGFLISSICCALMPVPLDNHDLAPGKVYWTYLCPAMCCATVGVNVIFNVTNIFCTTSLPKRDQAALGGVINSLSYLAAAFWLGVSDAVLSTVKSLRSESLSAPEQYRIGFWLCVGLAGMALCLSLTARLGSASSEMTADEKEEIMRLDMLASKNEPKG